MLNFNELTCEILESYSFVGLSKCEDRIKFHLPKGFQSCVNQINTFETKRDLFFLFYKVLRRFRSICIDKGYLMPGDQMLTRDRDGVLHGESGAGLTSSMDEIIFYAKLDEIGSLLSVYDEYRIAALTYRLQRTEEIDLSKIHKYLHQGVFLPDGSVYIDSMVLPRQQVQFKATDIVALYCYLTREVRLQLGDEVNPEVIALAEDFSHRYLGAEDSLFVEQSYEIVVDSLKDALDVIDRQTPLKDEDYSQFYDVIEQFLYGDWQHTEDGEIWGINNFYSVWESICLNYLVENTPIHNILFIDRKFVASELIEKLDASPNPIDLTDAFSVNGRRLVPDAVISPPLARTKPFTSSYILQRSEWDDYSYRTTFDLMVGNFENEICIAHIDQSPKQHTFDELKRIYRLKDGNLVVNSPLPEKYYSYWWFSNNFKISFSEHWEAMRYLNHIFYVATKQGIREFDGLQEMLSTCLGVSLDHTGRSGSNVFSCSMFRGRSIESLERDFKSFVEESEPFISNLFDFEVIDIKYLDKSYLRDPKNINSLKARSVRKQFVYEYLLDRQLKNLSPSLPVKIRSSFWIPSVCSDRQIFEDEAMYLDGYLDLVGINIGELLMHYAKWPVSRWDTVNSHWLGAPINQPSVSQDSDIVDWSVGDKLLHDSFGIGQVTHVFASGKKMCLAIKFSNAGQKIVDPQVIPLRKVE